MKRLVLGIALAIGGRATLAAQGDSVARVGVIDGIVRDTAFAPLADASVTILRTNVRVQTGGSGHFRIVRVPAGQYLVIVRHLGHRPASGIIEVAANDTARLSYALEPAVPTLEGVVVTERRLSSTLVDFEQRRRFGQGTFLTQADIDRRNAVFTRELFEGIPSVKSTGGAIVSTRVGGCRTELFVDGVRLPERTTPEDLPIPKDIAAIEVYAGPATIPPQFAGGRASCGVVLIWTRYGS